jgi:DNA-binding GntR family transcriptional regulator
MDGIRSALSRLFAFWLLKYQPAFFCVILVSEEDDRSIAAIRQELYERIARRVCFAPMRPNGVFCHMAIM